MNLKLLLAVVLFAALGGACAAAAGGEKARAAHEKDRAALDRAAANIEKFRKGDARLALAGFREKNLRIVVRQTGHDFKFGCYLKIDNLTADQRAVYENYFRQIFNYAVIGTYWDVTENRRGEHFWTNFEAELAMAARNEWRVQAAPLLWGSSPAGTPAWLPRGRQELRNVVAGRLQRYFANYPQAAVDIELVNETLSPEPDLLAARLGKFYVDAAFRQARALAPASRLIHNEYGVFGAVAANNYNRDRYFELLGELGARGVPFDVVGIQAHANREWYAPADVAEQLDRYAAHGKPIQITEFSAQTKNYDDRASYERILGPYRAGTWDDARQAEFYREFYTVAFGHPAVEAIVQWGLDDSRAWLPGIGVIGEDLRPKPNFAVLDELINRTWRTNLEIAPDGRNFAEFRGFFGVYEIEVRDAAGKTLARETFELKKDAPNDFVVRPAPRAPQKK